jgi:YbbR domain-containing protein
MSHRMQPISRQGRLIVNGIRRFFDTGNLLRFLVSIVLAFGLWAWVTYENDPETTRVMGGLPVEIVNLSSDLQLTGDPPAVDVTIQGPQSVVTPLERESVIASVDMEDVDQAGEYDLEVSVDAPSDVRVRDVAPDDVIIEVE